jgi:nicotinamidase-related amidase
LPFVIKIATKDHHPRDHISFASNHEGKKPFTSLATIINPHNPEETYESRLWPDHCVIGTPGNELLKELQVEKVDRIVLKGIDPRVEMYSAITSPFRNPKVAEATSEVEEVLRNHGVTHVYVVGLTGDYCVKSTAVDCAVEGGWATFVIEEGIRCVDPAEGWMDAKREMEGVGVKVIGLHDEALERVKASA